MGKISGFISAGIGLAVEAAQAQYEDQLSPYPNRNSNQQRNGYTYNPRLIQQQRSMTTNAPPPSQQLPRSGSSGDTGRCNTSGYIDAPPSYEASQRSSNHRTNYNSTSQLSSSTEVNQSRSPHLPPARLKCPIVIPQRRPEDKSRGWMLAYAPVLKDFGIDQDLFLRYLTGFNAHSKSSKAFDAVNIAAFGVGFVPDMTAFAVSMAVPIALHYAKKSQRNTQTESYLTRMNRELLLPRGLFAAVMIWRPDQAAAQVTIDSSTGRTTVTATPRSPVRRKGVAGWFGRKTIPEQELILPETAPLVFVTEKSIPQIKPEGSSMQRIAHFTADYFDRRAQAKYAAEHPNSSLAVQGVAFRNRWADPNHPANKSDLMTMLSGGNVKEDSNNDKKKKKKYVPPEKRGKIGRMKAEFLEQDLLYLMISNRPTAAEMAKTENFLVQNHMQ